MINFAIKTIVFVAENTYSKIKNSAPVLYLVM